MRLKVSNVCQLLPIFTRTVTNRGVTFTYSGDGSCTINGTPTGEYYSASTIALDTKSIKPNHKYLIYDINNEPIISELIIADYQGGYFFKLANEIFTFPEHDYTQFIFEIRVNLNQTANNIVVKPQFFDLTEMYGIGNEPTTVKQFRQDFPNEMYEYSPVCWKKFSRLKYVMETKNLLKLNDFSNSWLTIKNNTIRIKKTSDLQSYSDAIFSPLQTDLKSDKYYRISAKVVGEFTGRLYKFFGNSLWGNAINNNHWQSTFTLATIEDKYGLTINQNSGTTVGCTLISDEVFIYDIMLEESDTAFVGQAGYVPSGYLPLNRGKYIANKEPVQLLDKTKYRGTFVNNGITYTNNGNGTFTLNGTTTSASGSSIYSSDSGANIVKANHKYLMLGFPIALDGNNYVYFQYYPFNTSIKYYILNNANGYLFFTPTDDGDRWNIFLLFKTTGFTVNNITIKPQLFDLTEMYGAGNEPTTVEQFRADHPNELYDYNPYNAITFR